jgi:hypothetical protein
MSWFKSPEGQNASSIDSVLTKPEAELFDVPELVVSVADDEDVEDEEGEDDEDELEVTGDVEEEDDVEVEEILEVIEDPVDDIVDELVVVELDFWLKKTPAAAAAIIMTTITTTAINLLIARRFATLRIRFKWLDNFHLIVVILSPSPNSA